LSPASSPVQDFTPLPFSHTSSLKSKADKVGELKTNTAINFGDYVDDEELEKVLAQLQHEHEMATAPPSPGPSVRTLIIAPSLAHCCIPRNLLLLDQSQPNESGKPLQAAAKILCVSSFISPVFGQLTETLQAAAVTIESAINNARNSKKSRVVILQTH
jgi:hypothetical protein